MAAIKKDPEISALEAVHAALKDLDPESRRKVLASVYALLDISGPKPSDQPAAREERQPAAARVSEPPLRSTTARPKSLVELIQEKNPTTHPQRIALFAYYREKYEGLSRFGRPDLEPYFAKAKLSPPGNYARDFVDAVKRGWIHEDGEESYLTSKGIEVVEAGFAGAERP